IVRTIETLAFKPVGQDSQSSIGLQANNPTVAMLINREPTTAIEGQTIRAGLAKLRDILAFISTVLPEYRKRSISFRSILVDCIVIRVTEEKAVTFAVPHRSLGEFESLRQLVDLWIPRHDQIDRRIFA